MSDDINPYAPGSHQGLNNATIDPAAFDLFDFGQFDIGHEFPEANFDLNNLHHFDNVEINQATQHVEASQADELTASDIANLLRRTYWNTLTFKMSLEAQPHCFTNTPTVVNYEDFTQDIQDLEKSSSDQHNNADTDAEPTVPVQQPSISMAPAQALGIITDSGPELPNQENVDNDDDDSLFGGSSTDVDDGPLPEVSAQQPAVQMAPALAPKTPIHPGPELSSQDDINDDDDDSLFGGSSTDVDPEPEPEPKVVTKQLEVQMTPTVIPATPIKSSRKRKKSQLQAEKIKGMKFTHDTIPANIPTDYATFQRNQYLQRTALQSQGQPILMTPASNTKNAQPSNYLTGQWSQYTPILPNGQQASILFSTKNDYQQKIDKEKANAAQQEAVNCQDEPIAQQPRLGQTSYLMERSASGSSTLSSGSNNGKFTPPAPGSDTSPRKRVGRPPSKVPKHPRRSPLKRNDYRDDEFTEKQATYTKRGPKNELSLPSSEAQPLVHYAPNPDAALGLNTRADQYIQSQGQYRSSRTAQPSTLPGQQPLPAAGQFLHQGQISPSQSPTQKVSAKTKAVQNKNDLYPNAKMTQFNASIQAPQQQVPCMNNNNVTNQHSPMLPFQFQPQVPVQQVPQMPHLQQSQQCGVQPSIAGQPLGFPPHSNPLNLQQLGPQVGQQQLSECYSRIKVLKDQNLCLEQIITQNSSMLYSLREQGRPQHDPLVQQLRATTLTMRSEQHENEKQIRSMFDDPYN